MCHKNGMESKEREMNILPVKKVRKIEDIFKHKTTEPYLYEYRDRLAFKGIYFSNKDQGMPTVNVYALVDRYIKLEDEVVSENNVGRGISSLIRMRNIEEEGINAPKELPYYSVILFEYKEPILLVSSRVTRRPFNTSLYFMCKKCKKASFINYLSLKERITLRKNSPVKVFCTNKLCSEQFEINRNSKDFVVLVTDFFFCKSKEKVTEKEIFYPEPPILLKPSKNKTYKQAIRKYKTISLFGRPFIQTEISNKRIRGTSNIDRIKSSNYRRIDLFSVLAKTNSFKGYVQVDGSYLTPGKQKYLEFLYESTNV